MVKFCETRFAQSELKAYANFEKNYSTYRRTWGVETEEHGKCMDNTEVPTTTTAVEQEPPQQGKPQLEAEGVEEEVDDWDEPMSVMIQRQQQHDERRQEQQQQQQHEQQQQQQDH